MRTAYASWTAGTLRYQPRLLAIALVEWIGTGVFLVTSVIFFVRVVGLTPAAVGVGMFMAGAVSMLVAVPVGVLADRWGSQQALVAVNLWRSGAVLGYVFVEGWWSFVAVTTAAVIAEQAAHPLMQTFIGERSAPAARGAVLAAHRTMLNIGISVGGLLGAVPLAIGSPEAFRWAFGCTAGLFAATAMCIALFPRASAAPRERVRRRAALRNRQLLALTAYDSLATMWIPILNVAFPLWLIGFTDAPAALMGVLYALNTITCVLLQIPMSRLVTTPRQALRAYAAGGVLLASSCAGLAITPMLTGPATVALLTLTMLLLTLGELFQVNGAWTLSFAIAPVALRAEYLTAFSLGRTASGRLYGPLLMTGFVLAWGPPGWLLLAVVLTAGALAPLLLRSRDLRLGLSTA